MVAFDSVKVLEIIWLCACTNSRIFLIAFRRRCLSTVSSFIALSIRIRQDPVWLTPAFWRVSIFLRRLPRDVDTSRESLSRLRRLRRGIVAEVTVVVHVHFLLLAALHRRGTTVCSWRKLRRLHILATPSHLLWLSAQSSSLPCSLWRDHQVLPSRGAVPDENSNVPMRVQLGQF